MSAAQQLFFMYEGAVTPPASCDTYFSNVSLLLHMDGTNGSTTFTDNSTNAVTVTPYSGAVLSTSNVKYGTASGDLTASSSVLNCPNSALFAFTGAPFTVEGWFYRPSYSVGGSQGLFSCRNTGVYCQFVVRCDSTGILSWLIGDPTLSYWGYTSTLNDVSIPADTWTHVALVGTATVFTLYVNGVASTSYPSGTANGRFGAWTNSTSPIYIGSDPDGKFTGYIDDVRITKGIARYTTTFTPPTAAFPNVACTVTDPYYNNVSLLMHYDGTNNETIVGILSIIDNSSLDNTVTASGNATTSTTHYEFGGRSLYLDDSASTYIYSASNASYQFGSDDFTVEGWFYLTNNSGIISLFSIGSYTEGILMRYQSSGDSLYIANASYNWNPTSNFTLNQWNHVALVRTGTTIIVFVNGTSVLTASNSANLTPSSNLTIGASTHNTGERWKGYIDEYRITKGVARYTSNFTVPTQAFSNSTSGDAYYNNVSLLLHLDTAPSVATGFIDNSQYAFITTSTGTPTIKTAVYKYGGSSVRIGASTTSVNVPSDTAFNLSTLDFTIECWVYIDSFSPSNQSMLNIGTFSSGILFRFSGNNTIQLYVNGANKAVTLSPVCSTGAWHHVAATRQSNDYRIFLDGIQQGATSTSTDTIPQGAVIIGMSQHNDGEYINGYIDDLRITKGIARYTANFTPPTAAFPNS